MLTAGFSTFGQAGDIIFGDGRIVLVAQQVFEQNLE